MTCWRAVLSLCVLGFALSCGDGGDAEAVFELPRDSVDHAYFSLPWPNDVYRTADGRVDVREFPNRRLVPIIDEYLAAISEHIDGWGTNTPVYFRFSEAIDEATLPADAAASQVETATVYLIDVDVDSPDRGTRHPIETHYRDEETVFWPSHCLAVRPVYGVPLAPGRRYAAVVTDGLRTSTGARFAASADLRAVRRSSGGDAAVTRARNVYGPAIAGLVAAGIDPATVISLAVFTTQDPTAELITARDFIIDELPAPTVTGDAFAFVRDAGNHTLVHGAYGPSPIFQHGEIPYENEGGAMRFEGGRPIPAGDFEPRFALSIPASEMPAAGYPIVLYAHGSGGDYESFTGDTAAELAAEGYAVMGVDQIHHGTRNPTTSDPVLLFFNFLNPDAFRDNGRQAALDVVSQARVVEDLVVPARITGRDAPVRFDAERIYFFGHSQGGNNGPLFLAIDDQVKAAVLSGAAATLTISLVEKVEPFDIPALIALFLRISGAPEVAIEREHIVYEHPVLALLQLWREADDNANYVHMLFDRPREGFAPKTILQTEGVADRFTTAHAVESLATAARIPLLGPVLQEIPAQGVVGLTTGSAPVTGNVARGAATAGLLQYDTGHFSAFDHPDAESQIAGFFRSLAEGPGTIPAP